MASAEITTLVDEKLSMQLDSVSWNKKFDLLALGAYMIDPDDSTKRIGKIFLMKLQLNETGLNSKDLIQEIDVNGVLDLRWEPVEQLKLAVATSKSFDIFELEDGSERRKLVLKDRLELNAMGLYLQWITVNKLVFSDSDGVINAFDEKEFKIVSSKKVHENLTWVVQCSASPNKLLFAGSDEGKFTGFLMENIEDEEMHYNKKFEVGVTSIIFLEDNLIAVGSYDDTLRIFSIDCTEPIFLSLKKKIEFGGAVWRTIPYSTSSGYYIVAACARNGVHIIHLNRESWSFQTLTSCMEYEGFLAYGLDVTKEETKDSVSFTIASCYFDNHQLHIWKTSLPK